MKSLLFFILSCAFALQVEAGSATWKLTPASGDWNTGANWMPAAVPNGPGDTATFAASNVTAISLSAGVEVNSVVFNPGASAFTITSQPGVALTISGAGVTNNSGLLQNFANQEAPTKSGALYFTDGATAGDSVVYTNLTNPEAVERPLIQFEDNSTAGSAQFINLAGAYQGVGGLIEFQGNSTAGSGTFRNTGFNGYQSFPQVNFRDQASAGEGIFTNEVSAGGQLQFFDHSTADHATITNGPAFASGTWFYDRSTAGNATIITEGGDAYTEYGLTYFLDRSSAGESVLVANGSKTTYFGYATVEFFDHATADHATLIANGGEVVGAGGGIIYLNGSATAASGTFTANGAVVSGAFGGRIIFSLQTPTAAAATLIANGEVGGGEGEAGGILFQYSSTGGTPQVQLHGSGFLDVQKSYNIVIGSLEGDGVVTLGNTDLAVGSNDLSTTFSGTIQDGTDVTSSSFTKVGAGTLALSGANTYNGPTTIKAGRLVLNNPTGLATGNGPVTVEAGTLGGRGPIVGAVTVGTGSGAGAVLAPGRIGNKPAVMTLASSLTFHADATCDVGLNTKAGRADEIIANGVTIDHAQFQLHARGGQVLPAGTVLTVISNTAATPIAGTFANLPDNSTITVGGNKFQASYTGGDGNDLTLLVIP